VRGQIALATMHGARHPLRFLNSRKQS